MQINWITVAAQIVNFLVLVWLLKRFLYGPIMRAMARREEEIRTRLENARDERERAQEKQRELDRKIEQLEKERESRLAAARREADALRSKLEAEARETVEAKQQAWLAQIDDDRGQFLEALRGEVRTAFRDVAQSALEDLANTDLAERLATVFIERLDALEGHDLDRFREGAKESGRITVESGTVLDEETRGRLTRALENIVGSHVAVDFEDEGRKFVGIGVRARSATVEWSLDDYLDRYFEGLEAHFPARPDTPEDDQKTESESPSDTASQAAAGRGAQG
jgi:F-type H+-transporting ATPase subunit b